MTIKLFSLFPAYIILAMIFAISIYGIVFIRNDIKRIISLNIFQTSICIFYISICYNANYTSPIIKQIENGDAIYINPIPQVLILTAIVVGLSITALALSMINKIK